MSETEQDKSELATPYKLLRAREKGTVARGADLGFLAAITAFSGYVWISGGALIGQIGLSARRALVAAPSLLPSPHAVLSATGETLLSVMRPLAFLVVVIFVIVLVVELVQTGVVFSTEPLKPDFARLSPTRGFKRVFAVRMLIETAKNILKLAVYAALAFVVIRHAQTINLAAITDAQGLADAMRQTGLRLLAFFVAGAVLFAILDQLISRRDFTSKMRMSRREVKRETRDREGDPRVKQRRRRFHRDFTKLSQSLRNIRGADVLVVNPVHLAVALRYDPKTMTAPRVVSQGAHQFALRLRKLAFVYGLVIVENKPLAQALYYTCELNRPIPDKYFKPVADIYISIRDRKNQNRAAGQSV